MVMKLGLSNLVLNHYLFCFCDVKACIQILQESVQRLFSHWKSSRLPFFKAIFNMTVHELCAKS